MSNSETSCKVVNFSTSIRRSEFLIYSIEIVANWYYFTKMLSLILQSLKLNLSKNSSHVKDVIDVVEKIRNNSLDEFKKYLKNAYSDRFS